MSSIAEGTLILHVFHDLSRYYDDFSTIDWIRDRTKDRRRRKKLEKSKRISCRGFVDRYWDAASGWLLVFLVGVSSGLLAGVIDVGAEWMSDLKDGICVGNGWYSKDSCCWLNNDTSAGLDECEEWQNWSSIASKREPKSGWVN